MVDISRLLGPAPTATVASSSRSGGGAGHVKKANKKMLGMTAHSHGVAVDTVVSVLILQAEYCLCGMGM